MAFIFQKQIATGQYKRDNELDTPIYRDESVARIRRKRRRMNDDSTEATKPTPVEPEDKLFKKVTFLNSPAMVP